MDVTHATFTLERMYDAPVDKVFAAWSDPEARRRWFANGADYEQRFEVGGGEQVRAGQQDGPELIFTSSYHDIVPHQRIIYTSTLSAGEQLSTVSVTSVEFSADGEWTRLVITEHGIYLPGQEQPDWRERGTADQLTALATELGTDADRRSPPTRSSHVPI
jgi:uncharacterized protein YndB with AHSA1/START domain